MTAVVEITGSDAAFTVATPAAITGVFEVSDSTFFVCVIVLFFEESMFKALFCSDLAIANKFVLFLSTVFYSVVF